MLWSYVILIVAVRVFLDTVYMPVFYCFRVITLYWLQLLRLTSRKPLWLDLQPVDIKSRWRHNWKSAQVVNSHLVCDPTIRQPGFDLPRQQWSLLNRFRSEQGHCGVCRRKWRFTLICVFVARSRRCPTLSNPVLWQSWMAAYPGYTLQMTTLFLGWQIMVHDTYTRKKELAENLRFSPFYLHKSSQVCSPETYGDDSWYRKNYRVPGCPALKTAWSYDY